MKKLFTLSALLVAGSILVTSCNRTVTPRKLDGDWTVVSGERSTTTSDTYDGVTYTSSTNSTYNGSTWTVTETESGETETYTVTETIDYSFDRSTGEYMSTSVMTDPEYSEWTYIQVYDDADGNWSELTYVDRNTSRTSTTDIEGLFTITGDAGDEIEPNSQVVFQERTRTETYTDTYTYTDSENGTSASVAGKYWYDWSEGDYVPFPTSETGTETITMESTEAMVWNISELGGGEMMVEYTNNYSSSESGSSYMYTYTSSGSMTLEEK